VPSGFELLIWERAAVLTARTSATHKDGELETETGQTREIERAASRSTAAKETVKITWKQPGGKLHFVCATVRPQ